MRFQQIRGPAMAKGLEDTVFYMYNRLALSQRGRREPRQVRHAARRLSRAEPEAAEILAHALIATSTHDSKRSEDVRARINVLSEIPEEWKKARHEVEPSQQEEARARRRRPRAGRERRILSLSDACGHMADPGRAPAELGDFVERMKNYLLKAHAGRRKVNTSWINPRVAYEEACAKFVEAILAGRRPNEFLDDFEDVPQERSPICGMCNSLSQTLLKIMSPGVPDFYQGTELWSFNLVDPDNRRPVDYERGCGCWRDLAGRSRRPRSRDRGPPSGRLAGRQDKDARDVQGAWLSERSEAVLGRTRYVPLQATGARAGISCALCAPGRRRGLYNGCPPVPHGTSRRGATSASR